MTLDHAAFTPWASLIGGMLIGAASALLALGLGRIAGITGIVSRLVEATRPAERRWRLAFVLGLLAAPWLWRAVAPWPDAALAAGPWSLVAAGLLVGWGTRQANGCTSGHGVCGLSRLAPRSLVATLAFMGTGFLTVGVARHLLAAGG